MYTLAQICHTIRNVHGIILACFWTVSKFLAPKILRYLIGNYPVRENFRVCPCARLSVYLVPHQTNGVSEMSARLLSHPAECIWNHTSLRLRGMSSGNQWKSKKRTITGTSSTVLRRQVFFTVLSLMTYKRFSENLFVQYKFRYTFSYCDLF